MRTSRWLRFGLTSLMIGSAAMAAALVACSDDDDNNGNPNPIPDAATDTSTPVADAAPDAPPPPKKEPAKLQLVNAATDLNVPGGVDNDFGLLRFCYQLGPNVYAPLPALPDEVPGQPVPGVPFGIGGPVATTGADLSALAITPVILNGAALAARGIVKKPAGTAGMTCGEILGPGKDAGGQGDLVEGVDYWTLETIPAQSLLANKSYILVLTGCPSNTTIAEADRAKCGADFVYDANKGNGNLKIHRFEVDRATKIDATKVGTQFAHASPAGADYLADNGGIKVVPGYVVADGGSPKPVVEGDAGVALGTLTPLVQVDGIDFATWAFSANVFLPVAAGLAIPLPQIEKLSVLPAGTYKNGAAYTFVAVGDPTEETFLGDGTTFNTKKFHYLGLPNDPAVGIYGQ